MAEWDEVAQRAWDSSETAEWIGAVSGFIDESVDALKEYMRSETVPKNLRGQAETFLVHSANAVALQTLEAGGGMIALASFLAERFEHESSPIRKVQLAFATLVLAHQAGRGDPGS